MHKSFIIINRNQQASRRNLFHSRTLVPTQNKFSRTNFDGKNVYHSNKKVIKWNSTAVWISDSLLNKNNGQIMENFSDRDHTIVRIKLQHEKNIFKDYLLCSWYCPEKDDLKKNIPDPGTNIIENLTNYALTNNLELIICCNSNHSHPLSSLGRSKK